MVIDGQGNGKAFLACTKQLKPTLAAGDVVVTENLAAYKVKDVRCATEVVDRRLVY